MLVRLLLALLLVSGQGAGALHALEHLPEPAAKHETDSVDTATTFEERCATCEALCSGAIPPAARFLQPIDAMHDRYEPMRDDACPPRQHDGPGIARGPPSHA